MNDLRIPRLAVRFQAGTPGKVRETARFLGLAMGMAAALVVVGCRPTESKPANPEPDVVARVGDAVITKADLEAEIARRPPPARGGDWALLRDKSLQEMIRHQVLLRRAKAAGMDQDPGFRRQVDRLLVSTYEASAAPDYDRLPAPTEIEVAAEYEARQAEFVTPEARRASWILLRGSPKATDEKRRELRARAERLLREASEGSPETFAALARQHSEDRATRNAGGDLGWIARTAKSAMPTEPLVEALYNLAEPGLVDRVLAIGDDWCVVRWQEARPAATRPLEEVRAQLVHGWIQRRRRQAEQAFETSQRDGIEVAIDSKALSEVAPSAARALVQSQALPASPSLER